MATVSFFATLVCRRANMAEYLEELDNELGQVFAEFATFLYVTLYDSNSNKMLHNIFPESRRVHIRTLCDFFSNTKKPGTLMI